MTNLAFVVFATYGFPEQMQLMIKQTLRKQSNWKKEMTALFLPTETKLKLKLLSAKPHFVNAQIWLIKKLVTHVSTQVTLKTFLNMFLKRFLK